MQADPRLTTSWSKYDYHVEGLIGLYRVDRRSHGQGREVTFVPAVDVNAPWPSGGVRHRTDMIPSPIFRPRF